MSEDYLRDPRANTTEGLKAALDIFSKHLPRGDKTPIFLGAEHDIIYAPVSTEVIPEDSEDGIALSRLGWHMDDDTGDWGYFT
jgi:hypothetical protein